MTDDNKTDATPLCPFFKEPCLEAGCRLWSEAKKLDQRMGTVTSEWQCGLTLQPIIMVASGPPQPMGFGGGGGLIRPR